jgi:DNA repair exonuclease SbcCD nuclease subunit
MTVALTADLHLTTRAEHPERYRALEDILRQMAKDRIEDLVIAGDLFNEETRNYAEFEAVCRDPRHRMVRFHLIPGNHDAKLSPKSFAADNVFVVSEPEWKQFDLVSLPMLLLPYRKEQSMGEALAAFQTRFKPGEWILVGHGDWVEGMREPNPFEPGVYMPLTRTDLEAGKPIRVILGHVHKPCDREPVHYPGSPCGLDITETGRRRFLVLDTETGAVESRPVRTDVLFFNERLVVIPVVGDEAPVRASLTSIMDGWKIDDEERKCITLRLRVNGVTTDKTRLRRIILEVTRGVRFDSEEGPDLSGVSVSDDADLAVIAESVRNRIDALPWPSGPDSPTRDEAFLHALRTIYEP